MCIKIYHEDFKHKHLLGKILDTVYVEITKPEFQQWRIVGYIFTVDGVEVGVSLVRRKTQVNLYIKEIQDED